MESEGCGVVRRLVEEVANQGLMTVIDELVAGDFREHATPPGLPSDREVLKQAIASRKFLGDAPEYRISELSEDDGLVTLALEECGQGPEGTCSTKHRIQVVEGKIAEHWGFRPLFSAPQH